jgi:Secretion system C-terminal sorting domain/NHL repeat
LIINTVAGNGAASYGGDGGAATLAQLNTPYGVAVDNIGNVYIADNANNRIRKIDTFGIIHTIAGIGLPGFTGDYGAATAASMRGPRGIAVDKAGNVYFSDYNNSRIRKISTSGIITTIAGNGLGGYGGDGGPAISATINGAWGVAVDTGGNIFIADQLNCRVRKINTTGVISTIAGTGICFSGGDGGPAVSALVQYPYGVACDTFGNIYIADNGNNRVRKINAAGIITTIAGGPTYGFTGDGGPSTAARLYYPEAIACDLTGNVYISDLNNNRIRMINTAGIINTIAGTDSMGYFGDGGSPLFAWLNRSTGIAVGKTGKIYISDNNNNRVRIIHVPTHAPYFVMGDHQTIIRCPTEEISLDSALTIFDVDTSQAENWSLVLPPSYGTATVTYSATSTGAVIMPIGLKYRPALGFTGNDTFKVRIFDGFFSDTATFYITILPLPDAGVMYGADSLCPGDTATYTDTTSGGVWSTGSPSIATVTSTGFVTAVLPGVTQVIYTVTNVCGSASAVHAIKVRTVGCPSSTGRVAVRENGLLRISPNPGSGKFKIMLSTAEAEEVQYSITDMMGHKVMGFTTFTNTEQEVSLQQLSDGIYFVTASSAHGTWVDKLILMN